MKLPYDLVMVLWDDPGMVGLGWTEDKDIRCDLMLARNVGFLVAKDRTHIMLAGSIGDPDTTMRDRMSHHAHFQIARSLIKRIDVIGKRGAEFPASLPEVAHAHTVA